MNKYETVVGINNPYGIYDECGFLIGGTSSGEPIFRHTAVRKRTYKYVLRDEVADSLDRSIEENAEVWRELAEM